MPTIIPVLVEVVLDELIYTIIEMLKQYTAIMRDKDRCDSSSLTIY
jgi:hypothetical protein